MLRHCDMSVYFSDVNRAVAQHLLNIANIDICFQKACSKGMPKHVRGDMEFYSRNRGIFIYHPSNRLVRYRTIILIYKKAITFLDLGEKSAFVIFHAYIGSCSQALLSALYVMTYAVSMFGYFWFLEIVLKKKTLGKLLAKYKPPAYTELYDRNMILLHICCRIIACLIYPVTILYLMFTGRMIYDTLMSEQI